MVPTMAFIEIFGLDYKLNLLKPFFKRTILENKNFKNIFSECNNINEVINLFHLKEYKSNDMLSSSLPDDIKKKIIIIYFNNELLYIVIQLICKCRCIKKFI